VRKHEALGLRLVAGAEALHADIGQIRQPPKSDLPVAKPEWRGAAGSAGPLPLRFRGKGEALAGLLAEPPAEGQRLLPCNSDHGLIGSVTGYPGV